ncbi:2-amino-4-hydroxy-6-hydroxymethyldihydropteridine diphosphokinase [Nitrolancea hollandica]|uniref:2-amino-4-hydroxy-6-hydroxymethyldihydropteridine pyrophosphokinase n=1 Tax=Nitrolancea hollandica Lb TaxID=1129897 RepID=I4EDP6_9BACT|nr:2-amino-4-hydroxy-6-hydroxymethyldihydropteridine diphosphokinase [Nitrolancea hollandica]CCF82808.1 2-amino-4-hydroxy-6-hydroxymethyldihydropteridinepyrophosphokinase (7,8-dihydro-6-hydroxymethylpterin-pyrophosphokinase) (HPPK) (6-hydroxymethyl-7,8-dihydropterin pyrophosphokinase) (PPPK) [Nitrolancea hollandica Lb]
MTRAYLGLGANLGDRRANLRTAVDALRAHGELVAGSSLYETEPVGYLNQPPFLNAVIGLETLLSPADLLQAGLRIERELGRERSFRNAPRSLDIDLLLYDGEVLDDPALRLPHPRLHERAFVLVPLAEIAPALRHPSLNRTIAELLAALGDTSTAVRRVSGPNWANEATDPE